LVQRLIELCSVGLDQQRDRGVAGGGHSARKMGPDRE
jgi:hypothetical protein